jgi:hypothetical protein
VKVLLPGNAIERLRLSEPGGAERVSGDALAAGFVAD